MPTEQSGTISRKQPGATEKALRLLARRAFSEKELTRKLYSYGCYTPPEIRQALDTCRKHGFINDKLLSQDYARALNERNCGSRKIRQQLKKRGFSENLTETAVTGISPLEKDAAQRALDYKLRMLSRETDPQKKRQKIYRYLASKGFSYDIICSCMKENY